MQYYKRQRLLLPRDALHSAVLGLHDVRLSVRL